MSLSLSLSLSLSHEYISLEPNLVQFLLISNYTKACVQIVCTDLFVLEILLTPTSGDIPIKQSNQYKANL